MNEQLVAWRGQRIEDMSREDLIEALTDLAIANRDQNARVLNYFGGRSPFLPYMAPPSAS